MLVRLLTICCALLILGIEVVGPWHVTAAHPQTCGACVDPGDVGDDQHCDLCDALALIGDGQLPQMPVPSLVALTGGDELIRQEWTTPTDSQRWRNRPARGPPDYG